MKTSAKTFSVLIIILGVLLLIGGLWGVGFTYRSVAREKITTPTDAAIPGVPVRGPLTLKAQADIIFAHTLNSTDGKTFAEMPRQIAKLDAAGNPVLNEKGEPVMVANAARDIWITSTTLRMALNLALIAYAVSGLAAVIGLAIIGLGFLSLAFARRLIA